MSLKDLKKRDWRKQKSKNTFTTIIDSAFSIYRFKIKNLLRRLESTINNKSHDNLFMETAIEKVLNSNEDLFRKSKLLELESSTAKLGSNSISNENINYEDNRNRSGSLNKSKHRYADIKPKINTRILKNEDNTDKLPDDDGNKDLNNSFQIR